MILVTGAAGQLGRAVIEHLLTRIPAQQIVAGVRHPDKVSDLAACGVLVRQADYDVPEDWLHALEGVEKVLLVSSPEVGSRTRQHRTVVNAVAAAKSVKLLAYTSMLRAPSASVPYASEDRDTENSIVERGIPYAFLRHGWYTENYTMNASHAALAGKLYGCAKDGRISGASRLDFAEAAATVLTSQESIKPVYELAGDSSFTLNDVAAEISKQSGMPVDYVDLSEHEYRQLLVSYGLSENLANTLAQADSGAANGDVYSDRNDLSSLIGRRTTPLASSVKAALTSSSDGS